MQDLQSCLGLGEARCRCEVWRNHYEHASDTGERCRKRIHVVVVGFEELHALLLPLCRFLGIPYDPANLLALCKKRARNCAAYIPCDSHDCVHIDGSSFLLWLSEMLVVNVSVSPTGPSMSSAKADALHAWRLVAAHGTEWRQGPPQPLP